MLNSEEEIKNYLAGLSGDPTAEQIFELYEGFKKLQEKKLEDKQLLKLKEGFRVLDGHAKLARTKVSVEFLKKIDPKSLKKVKKLLIEIADIFRKLLGKSRLIEENTNFGESRQKIVSVIKELRLTIQQVQKKDESVSPPSLEGLKNDLAVFNAVPTKDMFNVFYEKYYDFIMEQRKNPTIDPSMKQTVDYVRQAFDLVEKFKSAENSKLTEFDIKKIEPKELQEVFNLLKKANEEKSHGSFTNSLGTRQDRTMKVLWMK